MDSADFCPTCPLSISTQYAAGDAVGFGGYSIRFQVVLSPTSLALQAAIGRPPRISS